MLPDRHYIERARISIRTGDVLSSAIMLRSEPIFSQPQEWVLDPYQGSKQMLSDNQYTQLVQELTPRFGFKRTHDRLLVSYQPGQAILTH